MILFWLALVSLVVIAGMAMEFAIGNRSLKWLKNLPAFEGDRPPKVSVIVAARNEARKIEEALKSLLRQSYPNVELIVVNDRSTDETGAILGRMTGVKVVEVRELPAGWLGKCHAHQAGTQQATGELLLFTDADIVMEPTTISRAVQRLVTEKLDHLAVAPHLDMRGTLLNMFGGAFTIFFGLYAKPWKARDPKSKRFIGIGAFNLVRAEAYRAVEGHERIRMRPDDDMKLGKIIKDAGYRQDMVLGESLVRVEWYASVRELVRGLEKNSFAGVEYSVAVVIGSCVAQLVAFVWPVVALAVTGGATRWLNLGVVATMAVMYVDNAPFHGLKRWHFVGFPVTVVLFLYIICRATFLTLRNDGIDWRGTHYSLAELRTNKV